MSQYEVYPYEGAVLEYASAPNTAVQIVEPKQRALLQPILLTIPVLLASVSVAGGGLPILTDLAFVVLTFLCILFFVGELLSFSERFGIAGLVVYGGTLVWICHDYFTHWALGWIGHWKLPEPPYIVAKASAAFMLYCLAMSIGIRIRWGKWAAKLMTKLPEPRDPGVYFWVMIVTQIIGISPYFVFTSEPFYLAIWHAVVGGRGGLNTAWTVGRTGNVNYSWGAYVAQMLDVGTGGANLAAFCIVFLRQGMVRNVVCAFFFLFWLGVGFGTGTRGDIVFMFLPVLFFLFIRSHVEAQERLKRFSLKAYVVAFSILFTILIIVQTQIAFRNVGFSAINMQDVSLTDVQGNAMFSEGIVAFEIIPERHPYFFDTYPGETYLMPIPNFFYWMVVSPIPRALWTTKPIDPVWAWYNDIMTGGSGNGEGKTEGTTISQGIAGWWFIRFGVPGILEGGILMGWIMSVAEMALLNNRGRIMAVFIALGVATWIFRDFRGVGFWDFYQFTVGLAGIALCTTLLRPFVDRSSAVVTTDG